MANKVGAILLADISHIAGLVAKGLMNDPIPHCHIVTTTTHKTLRGPRGGLIMMGDKNMENPWGIQTKKGTVRKLFSLLDSAVFPGSQGGPLEHVIAAKAIAFGEALKDEFRQYGEQVIKNARAMAEAFQEKGYKVSSGGTDNHSMLIDLRPKGLTGKDAEDALVKADITCNKNMVPFDDQPPMVTSGIRLGTPAITTRGLKEDEIRRIVEMMDEVLMNKDDEQKIEEVREKVNSMMKEYPLFAY